MDSLLYQNNNPSGEHAQGEGPTEPHPVPIIGPAESDDDVIELSPRSYYQAMTNARTTRRRTAPRLNLENLTEVPVVFHNGDINSVNLEANASVEVEPPNDRLVRFICPICLDYLREETTTRCGHIFCKLCIERAIKKVSKCPMCRKRINSRGLIRLHLQYA